MQLYTKNCQITIHIYYKFYCYSLVKITKTLFFKIFNFNKKEESEKTPILLSVCRKSIFRQTVRLSRKVQDGIFFFLGLPQKCNFCGKRRNNGTDGIFATKRKFGSGIRDGVRSTMVLREVKKMTNRCKNGENSKFSPFFCCFYLFKFGCLFLVLK